MSTQTTVYIHLLYWNYYISYCLCAGLVQLQSIPQVHYVNNATSHNNSHAIHTILICIEHRKWYVVKHNCVTKGVFIDYNGQLHVSVCTGHLQVVLGELNLRSYYKHSACTWCRDLYMRAIFATSKATLWSCAQQVWRFCSRVEACSPSFLMRLHCRGARVAFGACSLAFGDRDVCE